MKGVSVIFMESCLMVSTTATDTPSSVAVNCVSAMFSGALGCIATCMALPSVSMIATMAAALKSGFSLWVMLMVMAL